MTLLQRLARRFGYDLLPRRKTKALNAQLVAILKRQRIEAVLDVGANAGQYGQRLRDWGYSGRIISFEPLASAHAALAERARRDPLWQVAPPMAIGSRDGEVAIQVSAESDMSSILEQTALLRQISPSSRIRSTERVLLRRLDQIAHDHVGVGERLFLKIDTQGFEPEVLDGAEALMPRLVGIQLEMSLVPLYEGGLDYRAMLERLSAAGFVAHLILPGHFERKLARQLEIDGVFIREEAAGAGQAAIA